MITPLKRIRLAHAHNLRDLGGIQTKDNRIIRWNKLFRSDNLTELQPDEWDILLERGIRTVVDLRSASEATDMPDRVPAGITLLHCPVQREQIQMQAISEAALEAFSKSLKDGYGEMITGHPELLVTALKAVIGGLPHGGVLFHCSAGKDRTGILSAILLRLLNAEDEDIIADYETSYTFNHRGINLLAREMPEFKRLEPLLRSDAENMDRLLQVFNRINLPAFLLQHGITEEEFTQLRAEVLE